MSYFSVRCHSDRGLAGQRNSHPLLADGVCHRPWDCPSGVLDGGLSGGSGHQRQPSGAVPAHLLRIDPGEPAPGSVCAAGVGHWFGQVLGEQAGLPDLGLPAHILCNWLHNRYGELWKAIKEALSVKYDKGPLIIGRVKSSHIESTWRVITVYVGLLPTLPFASQLMYNKSYAKR